MSVLLNAAPVSFDRETVEIGYLPDEGKEAYQTLRERHKDTHVFRFDARIQKIANVGVGDAAPLGTVSVQPVEENLLLASRVIQRQIVEQIKDRYVVLRDLNPVVFWSAARRNRLLANAIRSVAKRKQRDIEPVEDLDVFVRFRLDTRLLYPRGNDPTPYLGFLIDLRTANYINLPVSDLIESGVDPRGMFVGRRSEERDDFLLPEFETLGRVRSIERGELILTDQKGLREQEAPELRVDAHSVLLEPRSENLATVVRAIYGRSAKPILDQLYQTRRSYVTADGQRSHLTNTLKGLRGYVRLGFGAATATIGDFMSQEDKLFPQSITTTRPTCLFGPQGRKTGQYPDAGVSRFGPYQYMHQEVNEPLILVLCEASQRIQVERFAEELRFGFPDAEWKQASRGSRGTKANPYEGGLVDKYRLRRIQYEFEEISDPSPESYRRGIKRALGRLTRLPDLALVQTRAEYKEGGLKGDDNPYFVVKSEFMMKGVPVQAVTAEKVDAHVSQAPYVLNNVGLACYAKIGGTPWVISTRNPSSREVVIGIGYTESFDEHRLGPRKRYVGITTFFQGDGRYLAWDVTREVEFEDYAAALLESLRNTIRYVEVENEWEPGDRVRLIFHVYKPLKRVEIESVRGVVDQLLENRYEVEFAFLDLSTAHAYRLFDPSMDGVPYYPPERRGRFTKGKGVPERGVCYQLGPRSALLQLVGPREVKTDLDGAPEPMLIEIHNDSDAADLSYLVRQVYHFSFLSWRSFFPASEPVTILYSRWIAQRLAQLRPVSGWDSSTVTMGALRNSKWFL
jgi:hypothetical protein